MFDIPIIEVAIGLVFAYMLLSMICTIINEWISRFFSLRSNNLNHGLKQLLADPDMSGLAQELLGHHLIKGSTAKHKKPSYIASETFARVLIDIIDKKSKGAMKSAKTIASMNNALKKAKLPEEIKTTVLGLMDNVNTSIDDLRKNLQNWFDNSMERISGWYKRRIQTISFFVALIITVGFNVDTVSIGQSLWKNQALRTQIAEEAEVAVSACNDTGIEECSFFQEIKTARNKLEAFPIGWTKPIHESWETGLRLLLKIIGLLITTLAISIGAPFWFDILDKLNSIRSSGIKPKTVTR